MSLITIDQLLESVDLDFEPRWLTKNKNGVVYICEQQPIQLESIWYPDCKYGIYSHLKLAEFADKDWQECIYEVPRKETEKIESIDKKTFILKDENGKFALLYHAVNQIISAVNELNCTNIEHKE